MGKQTVKNELFEVLSFISHSIEPPSNQPITLTGSEIESDCVVSLLREAVAGWRGQESSGEPPCLI